LKTTGKPPPKFDQERGMWIADAYCEKGHGYRMSLHSDKTRFTFCARCNEPMDFEVKECDK